MYTLTTERIVQAPAHIVWNVIADIERYADYAPNLSRVVKTSSGPTPSRRCYDISGRGWNEACVLWEEGKHYSFVVDTSDYPYPFAQMKGTWGVEPVEDGTRILMRFDYRPDKSGLLGWLIHRASRRAFAPIIVELLDNWETEIQARLK